MAALLRGESLRLNPDQLEAAQAMASAGLPISKIAAVLGVEAEELGKLPEWLIGRIENKRSSLFLEHLDGPGVPKGKAEEAFLGELRKDLTPAQISFLAAYRETCSVVAAASAAKISRWIHYEWKRRSKKYVEAFELTEEMAIGLLEDEATRRAMRGILNPIFSYGKLVGHELEYSDQLLLARLKASMPARYRERFEAQLTGKDGAELTPLQLTLAELMTPAQLAAFEARLITAAQQSQSAEPPCARPPQGDSSNG